MAAPVAICIVLYIFTTAICRLSNIPSDCTRVKWINVDSMINGCEADSAQVVGVLKYQLHFQRGEGRWMESEKEVGSAALVQLLI